MIYLILFICLTVFSQVLLKKASLKNIDSASGSYLKSMLTNPMVLIAYGVSFLNIFIWILAISKIDLFVAFFFTGFIYVIMLFVDSWFFGEKINWIKLTGAICITSGVILLNS